VGVEVPGHVHQGKVLRADHVGYSAGDTHGAGDPIALADLISADLAELLPWPVPVVLENDVNLMALREIYRPGQERRPRDGAVVAVFDHGVGAGVLVSGRVHRGHSGAAGEIGHIPVLTGPLDPPRPGDPGAASGPARTGPARSRVAGFRDRCTCGLDSHVDCFATPERLTGELGRPLRDFAHAAAAPGHDADGALTPEGAAFWEGGTALGLGLVSLLHTVNPGWLLLMLPAALAEASPMDRVTAADLYRTAVETVLDRYAFSTTARDARAGDALRVSALSTGRTGRYMAARNASVRVVDEFVAHALGRDRCSRPPAPKAPAPAMTAVPGPDSRRKVEARKSRQLHHIMRRHDPEELVPAGVPRDEYLAEERQLLNLLDSRKITRDAVRELWEARFPQSRLLADEGRFDTFLRELVALQSHYPAANSA